MKRERFQTEVLLIEDNQPLALIIKNFLESNKKAVNIVHSGELGLKKILTNQFDIVLLDLGLPDTSGLSVLRSTRDLGNKIPCIIITNNQETNIEINSYEYGANQYHKKPLNLALLNVQIDRILSSHPRQNYLQMKEILIDLNRKTLYVSSKIINLSHTEYKLLLLLIESNGRIIGRDEIVTNILDYNKDIEYSSVDTMISRLRKKLPVSIIDTVIRIGYKINSEYLSSLRILKDIDKKETPK